MLLKKIVTYHKEECSELSIFCISTLYSTRIYRYDTFQFYSRILTVLSCMEILLFIRPLHLTHTHIYTYVYYYIV